MHGNSLDRENIGSKIACEDNLTKIVGYVKEKIYFLRIWGNHGKVGGHRRGSKRVGKVRQSVTWRVIIGVLLVVVLSWGGVCCSAEGKWEIRQVRGVDYVRVSDVWKFYGFSKREGRPGCVSYGAGNRTVSLRPMKQDFYVNNYRYILSYPILREGDELLISTVDMSKLVDPVLRPRLTNSGKITTIVLDPGHGGHDSGAVSRYAREKDCNLALGLKVRKKLEAVGFKVVMTRDGDYFLTLGERVAIANRTPNCLFVSLHHNSGRSAASGIETFTLAPHGTTSPFARTRRTEDLAGNNQDSENIALATTVHSHTIKKTGAIDRGIQRARFSVLCTIKRPAILFEGGFVTNPEEGTKISSDSYRELLAQCICDGIVRYTSQTRFRAGNIRRSGGGATRAGVPHRRTSSSSRPATSR